MRDLDYLKLLSREYPSVKTACSEIINLTAIQGLPKGTEYFFSDLHGEYEAFIHLLRSASGVIREKIRDTFGHIISEEEQMELANLIYYPERGLERCGAAGMLTDDWKRITIYRLVQICRVVSTKYTRSKVRKKMPVEFAYIIDELLHVDYRDSNKDVYYSEILHSIIEIGVADKFIIALCELIQNLTIDSLHIIGDIFDRGPRADIIMNELMNFTTWTSSGGTTTSPGWGPPREIPPASATCCGSPSATTASTCWRTATASTCAPSPCSRRRPIRKTPANGLCQKSWTRISTTPWTRAWPPGCTRLSPSSSSRWRARSSSATRSTRWQAASCWSR